MQKIDHIGIAVADLQQSIELYSRLLGTPCYKIETIESEQVKTAFFNVNGIKIELVSPINATGPISKFLQKHGEGMHHIAFLSNDISTEIQILANKGFEPLAQYPKIGADNMLVCFFHPKTTGGTLIELCQSQSIPEISIREKD